MTEVTYEFVKGQGWVARLPNHRQAAKAVNFSYDFTAHEARIAEWYRLRLAWGQDIRLRLRNP